MATAKRRYEINDVTIATALPKMVFNIFVGTIACFFGMNGFSVFIAKKNTTKSNRYNLYFSF